MEKYSQVYLRGEGGRFHLHYALSFLLPPFVLHIDAALRFIPFSYPFHTLFSYLFYFLPPPAVSLFLYLFIYSYVYFVYLFLLLFEVQFLPAAGTQLFIKCLEAANASRQMCS